MNRGDHMAQRTDPKQRRSPQRNGTSLVKKCTLAVLGAAMLASMAGCSALPFPLSGPWQGSDTGSVSTVDPAVPSASTLISAGICSAHGRVTGHVFFTHPSWGRSVLVTCLAKYDYEQDSDEEWWSGIAVLDGTGTIRWDQRLDNGSYEKLEPAGAGSDTSGNLFIVYNPGRYEGIAILRPTSESLQTIAGFYDSSKGSLDLYYAEIVGPNSAGLYAIRKFNNDCEPDCAGGTTTSRLYIWNGVNYVVQP